MVAPGIRGGNGFNADLCAEGRGAPPPPREQRERLRGCVGSAGAARRSGRGGGRPGPAGPRAGGHGPEQRLVEEPLPGGGLSLRSSGGCFPAWGGTRVPPWPRSSGDHGGKINAATGGGQGGEGRGVGRREPGAFALPARGRRQRAGTGFPEPSLCLKSLQSFERENPPSPAADYLVPPVLLCTPCPVAAGHCWPCSGQDFLCVLISGSTIKTFPLLHRF